MILPGRRTCINAENGTLAFAIINIIGVSFSSLASIVSLIYWTAITFMLYSSDERDKYAMYSVTFGQGVGVIFVMMSSFVAFLFAVFLIHGIVKKKPEHIKAYFVYGVVVNVLAGLGILAYTFLTITFGYPDFRTIAVTLIVCFTYSLILAMIRTAYKQLECIKDQYNHKLLESQNYLVKAPIV